MFTKWPKVVVQETITFEYDTYNQYYVLNSLCFEWHYMTQDKASRTHAGILNLFKALISV